MKKLFAFIVVLLMCGYTFAQNNDAAVEQYGTNIGVIDQDGSDNDAFIYQGASGSPVTNFGTNLGGDWKYGAFIDQIGNTNEAVIDMNSGSNGASIWQNGNSNDAFMELNASISKTTSLTKMGLDIEQDGNNNYANQKTVSSFGMHGVQGMFIDQVGNYNFADQLSIGGAGQGFHSNNPVEVLQTGHNNNNPVMSGNTFDVSATGLINPLTLPWAHKPAGDYTQYMNQAHGSAYIHVTGDDNNTAQYQEYTVWATSGNNDAAIDILGDYNDVAQGQLGESNFTEVDINGYGNRVGVSQFGDNITSTVLITGDNNVAGVQQELNGNDGDITQVGNGNFGQIHQH